MSSHLGIRLLCAISLLALSAAAAQAQSDTPAAAETVVVTGSRVISSVANSPTPLTEVTAEQLQATTPTDIPDALNKLPVFIGSTSTHSNNNASQNNAGDVLNLRNFGANRTLVLFDGHRVAPSNSDGTVDVDVLPQMLMQRVDVVTGGASAVYGSDAVTGVVNFVLDKKFSGVKTDFNAGISNYADAASYQGGIAAGTDLFGGRGHVEMSVRYHHEDNVQNQDGRQQGSQVFILTGNGTAANPYVNTINGSLTTYSFGGRITCGTGTSCPANGQQFVSNGVIGPFNPGAATGTSGIASGGDGAHTTVGAMTVGLRTAESFGRFSYDLSDTTNVYVQATASESYDKAGFQNDNIYAGALEPNQFFNTNAFLPAAAASQINSSTFTLNEYVADQGHSQGFQTEALDRNVQVTVGADGLVFDKYNWDVFYSHGESRLKLNDPRNENNQKLYAAEDAVNGPGGTVVCNVSQTSSASLYPGCVPLNPFGPTAINSAMYNYYTQDTNWIETNTLDDVGGSIAGSVFDDWAGPVKMALSGELRFASLGVVSNATPSQFVDCTGLRLCNSSVPLWQGNVAANQPTVNNNVWEFAAEADVPLLKDVPLVQSLDANIAGRYTDYSTSGAVQTWKVGLDWHVNDDVRFRATNSVDIRAPTLSDLFSVQQVTHVGFTDLHTGNQTGTTLIATQGNPNLVPEVARTYTAGMVLTPSFIPGLTMSVDYYRINLKNAITSISPVSQTIQGLCESSAGTSPFCALYSRPQGFASTATANYPSEIFTEELNAAVDKTEGWDLEADYKFDPASVIQSVPGSVSLRMLTNIQPVNESVNFPTAPLNFTAVSKGHVTGFVGYTLGDWSFDLQDRWLSGFPRLTQFGQVYAQPRGKSINYDDITITKKFIMENAELEGYLSVQNVGNIQPPIDPTNGANPGIYYLGIQGANTGYDYIGRYFTVGLRTNF